MEWMLESDEQSTIHHTYVHMEKKAKENTFGLSVFMGSWQAASEQEKRSRQRWENGKRIRIHIVIMWKRSNRIQHLPLMMTLYCYVLLATGERVSVWSNTCAKWINTACIICIRCDCVSVSFTLFFFMLFSYVFFLCALLCTAHTHTFRSIWFAFYL